MHTIEGLLVDLAEAKGQIEHLDKLHNKAVKERDAALAEVERLEAEYQEDTQHLLGAHEEIDRLNRLLQESNAARDELWDQLHKPRQVAR